MIIRAFPICLRHSASLPFLLLLPFLLTLAMPCGAAPAGNGTVDIGRVTTAGFRASTLGIPMFRPKTAQDAVLSGGIIRDTVYRNVEPSGVFKKPANLAPLEGALQSWARDQRDLSGFSKAGIDIAVIGFYEMKEGNISAEVRVYDVASGSRIFGKVYTQPKDGIGTLARHIADDLLRYIGHEEGVSNSNIVFVSNRTGSKEVWVMQADGTNQTQMTADGSLVTAPCFGARGGEVYFTSYHARNPDLYGKTLNRASMWAISTAPGGNMSPAWSEAAQSVAFVAMKDGNSEIYKTDRAGKNLQRLTRDRAIDASPTWSPDGSRIAFTSNRLGSPQIFVMNADGSGAKRITFQGTYNTEPAWSPDGRFIAYTGRVGGTHQIFVLDMQSGETRQITRGGGDNEDPTWAPNGQYLAFASTRSGVPQIYRMRADGSQVVQLTKQGANHSPQWGPAYE